MTSTPIPEKTLRASRHWDNDKSRIPPVIAVTGGIGCGKSACSSWLSRYDIPVVDADIVNACVLDTSKECLQEVIKAFGEDILDSYGRVHRRKMADIIFADAGKRRLLESILHPRIKQAVREQVQEWRFMGAPYILLVIPLLPATSLDDWPIDWTALIEVSEPIRIDRIIQRSHSNSVARIKAVIKAQSSDEEYRRIADEVINNDGGVEEFRAELTKFHERVLSRFGA